MFSDFLMGFIQVKPEDFYPYIGSLIGLMIGYRLISLFVLMVRVRTVKPI